MFVIAVQTELKSLASCAETNVMTRSGYQIVTEHEVFFVSKERFLDKYKGNLYMVPSAKDRLLTFEEASKLRNAVEELESGKLIKVKGKNRYEKFDKDGANYSISLPSSDVVIEAKAVRCEFSGNNSNIRVKTENSALDVTASNSTFDISADDTVVTMYVSNCFIELSGTDLKVMIVGNSNTVSGITDGIEVFSRGKKNEFRRKSEALREDTAKRNI